MKSEKQCERKGERTGEKGTHARSHTHARTHTYITLLDVNLIRISRQTEYVSPLNTHEICKIATTKTIIISRKMKCEYRIVDPGSVSFHLNNSVLLTNSFPSLFVCLFAWLVFILLRFSRDRFEQIRAKTFTLPNRYYKFHNRYVHNTFIKRTRTPLHYR